MAEAEGPLALRLAKAQQKFPIKRVKRSQINPAPYNPRKQDSYAAKKLEESLRRWGLAETMVWNEATGTLVGGHQRLKQIDKQEGYPERGDYYLDVSAGNLTLKEERELNVLLNNPSLQGQYDDEALADLIRDKDVGFDLSAAGFDSMDLQVTLDVEKHADLFAEVKQNEETQKALKAATSNAAPKIKTAEEKQAELEKIKQSKKDFREKVKERDDHEFIAVVVFADRAEQTMFMEAIGHDAQARNVDGYKVLTALGLQPTGKPE